MVNLRLEQAWTDTDGNTHAAGEKIAVDEATAAQLKADGIATDWAGPTDTDWAGPTGGQP
jgi:hypothetical protein